MARSARDVQGLAEAYSLFDQLPGAAEQELAVEMAAIGRELLAAQRADVPKATGKLEAALTLQLLLSRLKVRVGLIGIGGRAFLGRAFYGRFVEFGRRAQTVIVTRRLKRNGRKGRSKTGKPYKLRVNPKPGARPFVEQPFLAEVADAHLSDFWADALARIGAKP